MYVEACIFFKIVSRVLKKCNQFLFFSTVYLLLLYLEYSSFLFRSSIILFTISLILCVKSTTLTMKNSQIQNSEKKLWEELNTFRFFQPFLIFHSYTVGIFYTYQTIANRIRNVFSAWKTCDRGLFTCLVTRGSATRA